MGELHGKIVQPRHMAELAYGVGITDAVELVKCVAIGLAESQGYEAAFNDNYKDGVVVSRDCGIWEISIPASKIGTTVETDLYDRNNNVQAMYDLYTARGWEPWVAFTTGIYLRDYYMARAVRGIGNFLGEWAIHQLIDAGKPTNMIVPTLYFPQDFTYAKV